MAQPLQQQAWGPSMVGPEQAAGWQAGVPPEMMMQGMAAMQGVPMQMVMGPMGPMVAPMGALPPGAMAAPQLTQMLVDAARGGRSSNVFFKTRICNKWRAGSCPYGDKCTYAHGEHELRYVPPEIVAQLEANQKMQEAMAPRGGGEQQRGEEGSAGGPGAGPHGQGMQQSYYKTRLCIKYMQTGYCHKGTNCTFAHGYEDLRQPGAPMSPRMSQDPMSPGRMPMSPGGMAMMGGAPGGMMPMGMAPSAAAMAAAGRGMPMPMGMPGMMPMMAPPPQGRYAGQQQMQQRSPRAGGGYGGGGRDEATAARRRAAAMCQIAGVGEVGAEEPHPAAMQAAMNEVRSGAAFRDSPYADGVADLVRPHQGGN
ncbi:zinc finger CCCH domain-containing 56-like [Chlorella sorokiniana]|jgi:hypothetical protein|uniref:Zinc finger CCCH domain-containing 56-like n=1 Tax=Chlorella sorokiniana TaxID=3076 RepID=A0A2P6U1G9_CHLSO|nr:zinc finger CCCH domain-containing 56-like [Chlorella sorokiniana]|eukprot:PRW60160.1 zinc finger CCCH domain-containing 56-like [Chlorella sorokiniana]